MKPLTGKVAVVTGAAAGIGRAAAFALADAGADVALVDLAEPDVTERAASPIRELGRQAITFRVDVSDQAAVERMARETVGRFSRIDVFVSCAAYSDREPFLTADMTGFHKTLEVTMLGAFYGLRACCRQMVNQGEGGSAVIVSSPHARIAFPNAMAYNMAKAANDQMARTAATELLPHKIRVNIVYPGWTDTPGERKFFSEEVLREASKTLPTGRLARPDEIARAIVFLAEPASEYINGEVLHVDGGVFLPWWSKRGEPGEF